MKYYMQANRFLQKYGSDAFKIIAAYEEAADIPPTERYANWYGDYGIFEPSLNEEMTYDKLLSRYKAGLKYLGIINEQAKAVCENFLSEQLAEHIREQLGRHNTDAEYRPTSVITKMDTPELTRDICARTSRRSSTASLTNSAKMNASQLSMIYGTSQEKPHTRCTVKVDRNEYRCRKTRNSNP